MSEAQQNKPPIERAVEYGIDISLLERNLELSPEERLERLQEWVEFIEEIRKVNPRYAEIREALDQIRQDTQAPR